MPCPPLPADAFGDRFALDALPLARCAAGYAVQMLDTDKLLDRLTGTFLPVRSEQLDGLFDSFEAAYAAAHTWVEKYCPNPDDHRLAIVPASFDQILNRHVLIYGVLCGQP
ncbi:MAG: hypothetical protein KKE51_18275 [Gammaproteobacteria bacterium]|nr:hypothetical protein [Gammaproteobacteria bacterium]MBU1603244.1 hypothetical protein [Gammaproteobacteria bacterium]MBU2432764.1 hypothetical protein [Gammaproteobacteria bacterium]MBU2450007.1 hypothetical protein [Gammaproteobacteria bacterium]